MSAAVFELFGEVAKMIISSLSKVNLSYKGTTFNIISFMAAVVVVGMFIRFVVGALYESLFGGGN